jgi:hypothetical protein
MIVCFHAHRVLKAPGRFRSAHEVVTAVVDAATNLPDLRVEMYHWGHAATTEFMAVVYSTSDLWVRLTATE